MPVNGGLLDNGSWAELGMEQMSSGKNKSTIAGGQLETQGAEQPSGDE